MTCYRNFKGTLLNVGTCKGYMSQIFEKISVIYLMFEKVNFSELSELFEKMASNSNIYFRKITLPSLILTQIFNFKFGMQGLSKMYLCDQEKRPSESKERPCGHITKTRAQKLLQNALDRNNLLSFTNLQFFTLLSQKQTPFLNTHNKTIFLNRN